MTRLLLDSRQLDLFEQPAATPDAPRPHWPVRRSQRAKHLRINVHPDGNVEVVAPRWAKPAEVQAFVADNAAWVEEQLSKLDPIDRRAPDELLLSAVDHFVRIEYLSNAGETSWQEAADGRLLVCAGTGDRGTVLRDWLKCTARHTLTARVEDFSTQTGLPYQRLQWRVQKTRWGSCSSNRTISLNAAVLLLSPALADYVILHELCHLRYMSHGPRFWGLLSKHCGEDARVLDRQLSGFSLERYGWLYA